MTNTSTPQDLPPMDTQITGMAKSLTIIPAAEDKEKAKLVTDIWYMVIKEAAREEDDDPFSGIPERVLLRTWLRSLRLISREFNTMVTPRAFRYIMVDAECKMQRLLAKPSVYETEFKQKMVLHTKSIFLYELIDIDLYGEMTRFILSCKHLQSFLWQHPSLGHPSDGSRYLISKIGNFVLRNQMPLARCMFYESSTCLSIDRVDYGSTATALARQIEAGAGEDKAVRAIYKTNYDTQCESTESKKGHHVLGLLLLCGPHREIFGTRGFQPLGETMPSFRKLKLSDATWQYSPNDYSLIWDFSGLRCLSLRNTDIGRFLLHVPIEDLVGLRTFKLENWFDLAGWKSSRDMALLGRFIKSLVNECTELENFKFKLEDWQDVVDIADVEHLGGKLRKLRLIDGRIDGVVPIPMTANRLRLLMLNCPNISTLGLDLPDSTEEMNDFFAALGEGRNLQDLTLHTTGAILMEGTRPNSTDPVYDGAMAIMQHFHSLKTGPPLNTLAINYDDYIMDDGLLFAAHEDYTDADDSDAHRTRLFTSRINAAGIYEQWGHKRYDIPGEQFEVVEDSDRDNGAEGNPGLLGEY